MNYKFLLASILFGILSFYLFKLYKYWLSDKESENKHYASLIILDKIRFIICIILSIVITLVFFIKSFNE